MFRNRLKNSINNLREILYDLFIGCKGKLTIIRHMIDTCKRITLDDLPELFNGKDCDEALYLYRKILNEGFNLYEGVAGSVGVSVNIDEIVGDLFYSQFKMNYKSDDLIVKVHRRS